MRLLAVLLAVGLLSSCDGVYQSSRVLEGATEDAKVRVLPITAQSVLIANRESYSPRVLPAVFQTTAGGGQMRGSSTPPAPVHTAQRRPHAIETRLPPARKPEPYRIGVGDVLLLATPTGGSLEQLSGLLAAQNSRQGYTVQDDGSIGIADVGRVELAGMTLQEAEALLFQRLVDAQIDPEFTLEVAEFNSRKVSIGGAVKKPSILPLTLTPLYLKQAMALAGGSTARNRDDTAVRLYRNGTIYQIPLADLYANSKLGRIRLQNGDSLFVDEAYSLDQAEAYFRQQIELATFRQSSRAQALSNLQTEIDLRRANLQEARSNYLARVDLDAVDRDYAYMAGEVTQQGRFELPLGRQATLADALYGSAKGLSIKTADPRHIYVLRSASDPMEFDTLTAWQLDLRNAVNMSLATRFNLRPNDIIFVAERPVTRWARAIDQITPSLISIGANSVK